MNWKNVKKIWKVFIKKNYTTRYVYRGRFCEKDENKSPEDIKEFGQSRNDQRLQYMEKDKKFNPSDDGMKIYKPLYKYKNNLINYIYLFMRYCIR